MGKELNVKSGKTDVRPGAETDPRLEIRQNVTTYIVDDDRLVDDDVVGFHDLPQVKIRKLKRNL